MAGEPADHALGRSRGGFGTKLHLLVDGTGVLLAATLTPGEAHESRQVEPLLRRAHLPRRRVGRPRHRAQALASDKGYSYPTVRHYLRRRGIHPVISTRSNQRPHPHFDKQTDRRRSIIEQVVGWLKEWRRFVILFEKLAVNFLAMIQLATLQRCLRLLHSPNKV